MEQGSASEKGNSRKKRILIITVVTIACLAICLIAFAAVRGSKVTGVSTLVEANVKAQSKVKSYHMDGDVNMYISLDYDALESLQDKLDLRLPVKMTLSTDAGAETAHVITDASISILGKTVPVQKSELYLDTKNLAVYSRTGESTQWKRSENYADQIGVKELVGGIAIAGKTVLENASFNETDDFYTLTMPAEKTGNLIQSLHFLDRVDLGIADVKDITVEGGQIIYNVDKSTLLVSSVELKDVNCHGKGTYNEASLDLKFLINGTFKFSRYDELEESEYAIPPEVEETQAKTEA